MNSFDPEDKAVKPELSRPLDGGREHAPVIKSCVVRLVSPVRGLTLVSRGAHDHIWAYCGARRPVDDRVVIKQLQKNFPCCHGEPYVVWLAKSIHHGKKKGAILLETATYWGCDPAEAIDVHACAVDDIKVVLRLFGLDV